MSFLWKIRWHWCLLIWEEYCFLMRNNLFSPNLKYRDKGKSQMVSAFQLGKCLRKGLAALLEIKSDQLVEVPDDVAQLLDCFKDVMHPELPKSFIQGGLWTTKLNFYLVLSPIHRPSTKWRLLNWRNLGDSWMSCWVFVTSTFEGSTRCPYSLLEETGWVSLDMCGLSSSITTCHRDKFLIKEIPAIMAHGLNHSGSRLNSIGWLRGYNGHDFFFLATNRMKKYC